MLRNSISEKRKNAGMTQQKFADLISVSRQTVSALEKGNYCPSLELALRISSVFGEPVERLFTYDQNDK
jgi:putative transcriptional regulator